jgi:hypothetical protein
MPEIQCNKCKSYNNIREVGTRCTECKELLKPKTNTMETKYSKTEFEGYTHRFVVAFTTINTFKTNVNIYSNLGSYASLYSYIEKNKSDKVLDYMIIHKSTKEQDELDSKFIDEVFINLKQKI